MALINHLYLQERNQLNYCCKTVFFILIQYCSQIIYAAFHLPFACNYINASMRLMLFQICNYFLSLSINSFLLHYRLYSLLPLRTPSPHRKRRFCSLSFYYCTQSQDIRRYSFENHPFVRFIPQMYCLCRINR